MLTKAQIQRIAQRNGVGMQVQDRDYLQHLILWLLYRRSQELIFKGGTALRLVYGGNRYSEDLDFNGPADTSALDELWREVVGGLEDFGIVAEIRSSAQATFALTQLAAKDKRTAHPTARTGPQAARAEVLPAHPRALPAGQGLQPHLDRG